VKYNIAVLPGDGVGSEVWMKLLKYWQAVGRKYGHEFVFSTLVGCASIDATARR